MTTVYRKTVILRRLHQQSGLADVRDKFQHPENAQHPQQADDQQVLAARKKNAQVGRQNGQKIYDAEKAGGIRQRSSDAQQPQKIFDRKQQGENPFPRQSQKPQASRMPATLSSITRTTLTIMETINRTSNSLPAGVSASKIISCRVFRHREASSFSILPHRLSDPRRTIAPIGPHGRGLPLQSTSA
jgi:hypothetical protein